MNAIGVRKTSTIRETLGVIERAADYHAPIGIALVLGDDGRLEGVVTDGDIRKALVEDFPLDTPVSEIMTADPITVPADQAPDEMIRRMREQVRRSTHIRDTKVEHLITVDEQGRVVDVINTLDLLMRIDMTNWTVGVVGLGFVGLTLAVSLSEAGYRVHGIEADADVARRITGGQAHFFEVGLDPLLKHQLGNRRFSVHSALPAGLDIYVVAVGTPIGPNGRPILTHVQNASRAIGKRLKRGDLVVLRSTVPVGTTRREVAPILEEESGLTCGKDFQLAFAPERTVEGNALKELRSLPQIIGGFDGRSTEVAAQFFGRLASNIVRVESLEAAEMVKLVNNTFRDVSFAFANELAIICDHWNLDAVKIIESANRGYPRNPIPLPSPGVGGFCLTKDPVIYTWAGRDKGYEPRLPINGRDINELMVRRVADKVLYFFQEHGRALKDGKVFIIGFAFKGQPETSDVRHSTTVDLLTHLAGKGLSVDAYDPVVPLEDLESLGVRSVSLEDGFNGADAVLVMNNHRSYSNLDLFSLLPTTRRPALFFDGWHLFDRVDVERIEGITYAGLSGAI